MRLQLNILYARVNSDLSISHSHKPRLLTNTYLVGWCISGYEISHKCSIGGPLTTFCFYYHWKQLGSNCCLTHVQRSQKRHIHVPLLHCIYTLFLPNLMSSVWRGRGGGSPEEQGTGSRIYLTAGSGSRNEKGTHCCLLLHFIQSKTSTQQSFTSLSHPPRCKLKFYQWTNVIFTQAEKQHNMAEIGLLSKLDMW